VLKQKGIKQTGVKQGFDVLQYLQFWDHFIHHGH